MFAYIPARGGSKRIPRKNLRELGGEPILARVVRNLCELEFLSAVYVSTDDHEIIRIASEAGAQCLELRAPELSNDSAGFMDLIREDIPRFVHHSGGEEVLFVLATAALVPPALYNEAFNVWLKEQPDVLMSCEKAFPWWSMTQKADGYWWPLFPDKLFANSQDQPPALDDAGLFYFFRQSVLARFKSVKMAERLLPFVVPDQFAGDIDTVEDWDLLEYRFSRLKASR
jgi:CMP-N-acetylneuraminic acid synthetase